jgi:hypothetical protein
MSNDPKQTGDPGHDEAATTAVRVECYAGHRAEESPRRFFIGKRAIGVIEIIDRWLDPDHRYFKLRGDDGGIYILRYDLDTDAWEMTLFDSGMRDETRLSST